jgi:hypothetical protein
MMDQAARHDPSRDKELHRGQLDHIIAEPTALVERAWARVGFGILREPGGRHRRPFWRRLLTSD